MTQIESQESAWQRWAGRLLPALTFLVGLALGAAVIVAATGDTREVVQEPAPASPSPSEPTDGNGDTVVTLPGACEDAAQNITEATRLLDDVIGAVRDFRPQELVDLLNQLEDLDDATRPLATECAEVSVTEAPQPSESPTE